MQMPKVKKTVKSSIGKGAFIEEGKGDDSRNRAGFQRILPGKDFARGSEQGTGTIS